MLTIAKSAVFYDGGIKASSVTGIPYFKLAPRSRTLRTNAAKNHSDDFDMLANVALCGKLCDRLVSISIERDFHIKCCELRLQWFRDHTPFFSAASDLLGFVFLLFLT